MKSIYIPGVPDVKMRPRTTKKGHVYDPNAGAKEASIQKARVMNGDMEVYSGPLYVRYIFVFPRPRKHYRTGKFAHVLRDDAPEFYDTLDISKDVDNMEKFYADSFNFVHYRDDRQIVKTECFKRWALEDEEMPGGVEMPHVEMNIYRVPSEAEIDRRGMVTVRV